MSPVADPSAVTANGPDRTTTCSADRQNLPFRNRDGGPSTNTTAHQRE